MPAKKQPVTRVAIVGGGCSGVSAAWQLSNPALKGRYDIHLYEKDWRLGGKGASGRDANGRIIEHGLHLWLGFYENAFRMVRECYGEIAKWSAEEHAARRLTHYRFEDAFVPEPHIGVGIASRDRPCTPYVDAWSGIFAPMPGTPGDPIDEDTNPFTVASYLTRCFMLLKSLSQSVMGGPAEAAPGGTGGRRSKLDEALDRADAGRKADAMMDHLTRSVRSGLLAGAGGLEQVFRYLEQWARRTREETNVAESSLRVLEAVARQVHKQAGDLTTMDPALRTRMEVIDIVMTIALGLYRDRVMFEESGLDAINHMDYRDWLRKHGATEKALDSQFISGIYDLTFAYRRGDRRKPSLAAGVALRGALRMFFTYRGSMFWRMRSGMGDAVFAPLYHVLRDRGVQFHFMHSLQGLSVKRVDGADLVEEMTFGVREPQEPLLDEQQCWRAVEPRWQAGAPEVRLRGQHFDAVILALPIEALRELMDGEQTVWLADEATLAEGKQDKTELRKALPLDWRKAMRYLTTAATHSAQVWMRADLESMGWERGSTVLTAIDKPFQTWADMSHTLAAEEAWRKRQKRTLAKDQQAESVFYLCGVVPETRKAETAERMQILDKDSDDAIRKTLEAVLPKLQVHPETQEIMGLAESVYVANVESSGRYTLSEPGTVRYRLSPLDPAISNLALAGDWTACGLDAGCVESAVMSGMLAAHAITGDEPALDSIVGYDHP